MKNSDKLKRKKETTSNFLLYAIPLCFVFAIGAIHIPYPFHGDQALFMIGAKVLDNGGVLYVDFWDIKQPGIFIFFLWAGRLFGFSENGIHFFELLWQLIFTVILVKTLTFYFRNRWMSAFVPVVALGTYYAYARDQYLTQLEILVGLPIFLSLWFSSIDQPTKKKKIIHFFMSGLFAGVTVVFKLILAIIPVGFWILAALNSLLRKKTVVSSIIFYQFIPTTLGVLTVLTAVTLWFNSNDALQNLWWSSFVYPINAIGSVPRADLSRLIASTSQFCIWFAPWLPFVVVAIISIYKKNRDLITLQMLNWLVMGMVAILIQKFSWWGYHFLLLVVPVGILAVRGIDIAMDWISDSKLNVVLIRKFLLSILLIYIAIIPALKPWKDKLEAVTPLINSGFNKTIEYQRNVSRKYDEIWSETRFLVSDDAIPGPIYVFGDPLRFFLSGRKQAIPITGWAWEFFIESQWNKLPSQLEKAKPAYIFVAKFYSDLINANSAETEELIKKRYVKLSKNDSGIWYRIIQPGDHSQIP